MRAGVAAGVAIWLIVLAGCASPASSGEEPSSAPGGGGGGGGTPGTDLTACQIVLPADIEVALGLDTGTVAEGEDTPVAEDPTYPGASQCTYAGEWGRVLVGLIPADGDQAFADFAATGDDRAEDLDVGDGGLWFEDIERGLFLSGPVLVDIAWIRLTESVPLREPTIELGEAALARL
ncbi:MAG: hypothetical protein EHM90_06590 [Chloroflexi bacterium]|nr:MAG: hypothetical protein EHM90_06590 [Chloroflexota bacterium]